MTMPVDNRVMMFMVMMLGLSLLLPAAADAQGRVWSDSAFITASVGMQASDRVFEQQLSSPIYGEVAEHTIEHQSSSSGLIIDAGGGVRLWRGLGAGFGLTIFRAKSDLEMTGSVPHPLFFNRPRAVQAQASDLAADELAFHFAVLYVVPVTGTIDVSVFGGPSVIRATQDLVAEVEILEGGAPFTTARIGDLETLSVSETGLGAHVGADLTYKITPRWGAGGFFRYLKGSVDLPAGDGITSVDVGGLQVGAGIRLRF